jgi:hypothetical protein
VIVGIWIPHTLPTGRNVVHPVWVGQPVYEIMMSTCLNRIIVEKLVMGARSPSDRIFY